MVNRNEINDAVRSTGIRPGMHPLMAARAVERRKKALYCAKRVLDHFADLGVDGRIVGSLATCRFMPHSDIDFLVSEVPDSVDRFLLEAEVEERCAGLAFNLIFLDEVYDEHFQVKLLREAKNVTDLV